MDKVVHYEFQCGGLIRSSEPDRPICEVFVVLAHGAEPIQTTVVGTYFSIDDARTMAETLNRLRNRSEIERVLHALLFDVSATATNEAREGKFWTRWDELIEIVLEG